MNHTCVARRGPSHEYGLATTSRDVELLLQAFVEHTPVESFVIVRGTAAEIEDGPFHVLRAAGKNGRCELAPRVRCRSRVVTDLAPAGNRAHDLFDEHRNTGLDRHTDDQRAARREQPRHARQLRLPVEHMLEHFHAEDGVVSIRVLGTVQRRDLHEAHARLGAVASSAIVDHVSSSSAPTAAAGGESAIIASARNVPSPLP